MHTLLTSIVADGEGGDDGGDVIGGRNPAGGGGGESEAFFQRRNDDVDEPIHDETLQDGRQRKPNQHPHRPSAGETSVHLLF